VGSPANIKQYNVNPASFCVLSTRRLSNQLIKFLFYKGNRL
jgi:hypothetical protein